MPSSKLLIKVQEVFHSIQGEGLLAGTPMIFIRLHGCNLSCEFCDTPDAKSGEPAWTISVLDLTHVISSYPCSTVCITGGEPFLQLEGIIDLAYRLKNMGYFLTVETNGTISSITSRPLRINHVTFSPKLGTDLNPAFFKFADEIKCPVGSRLDIARYQSMLRKYKYKGRRFFQPIDNSPENINMIIDHLKSSINPWRLSCQLHKTWNIQ